MSALSKARSVLTAFLLFGAACSPNANTYELAIDLRTDLVPVEEFDQVQMVLTSSDEDLGKRRDVTVDAAVYLPGRRITELSGIAEGSYRLDVFLEDSARDRIIAKHPVLLTVKGNTSLTVPIDRSCQNVACPPLDDPETEEDESGFIACLGGQCVDPRCTLETPEFCGDITLCQVNTDCTPQASCAVGECELGVCWARPKLASEDGACDEETAWCHPESQCVPDGEDAPEAPSCSDGLQNGEEAGIDCGGSCPESCEGTQSTDDLCINAKVDPGEENIDCGGSCIPCPEDPLCFTQQDIPVHECLALHAIYEATLGFSWENNTGWFTTDTPCSDWYGIECVDDVVDEVDLGGNELKGTLPLEIGNLRNVTRLGVWGNSISGTLPKEIAKLSKLEVFVAHGNSFTGTLPEEFGNLPELRYLDIYGSALSGSIPPSLGNLSKMEHIKLSQNAFSGEIPESLTTLPELQILNLFGNALTGTIPAGFATTPNLEELLLARNQLRGEVPEELQGAASLDTLSLENNACLYATECITLKPWLDSLNPTWQSSNTDTGASCPPPEACP